MMATETRRRSLIGAGLGLAGSAAAAMAWPARAGAQAPPGTAADPASAWPNRPVTSPTGSRPNSASPSWYRTAPAPPARSPCRSRPRPARRLHDPARHQLDPRDGAVPDRSAALRQPGGLRADRPARHHRALPARRPRRTLGRHDHIDRCHAGAAGGVGLRLRRVRPGSAGHFAAELWQGMAGVRLHHVPYRGGCRRRRRCSPARSRPPSSRPRW